MLRITQQQNSAAAKSYYTEGLSRADYYIEGQELPGRWLGEAARRLGLSGEVKKDEFYALCDNLHPQTGERLTPRTKAERRIGYDCTFDAGKSVSVVYALTQDHRILEAFRSAVHRTVQEMEADVQTRVRHDGAQYSRTTGNLAAAEFTHLTSRPIDGIPDPQLHAHSFIFNLTWDEKEQRHKAIDLGNIKRDAPYYQAAFHARLAKGLGDAGYGITRTRHGFEISGVSREIIDKFSRRTSIIEALAREKGITDATAKGELGAKTRERKQKGLSMTELREAWLKRLSDDDRSSLHGLDCRRDGMDKAMNAEKAMDYALRHTLERSSIARERELAATALKYGVGHVKPEDIPGALKRPDLIRRRLDGEATATTREVLSEERAMLDFVRAGRGTCRPLHAHPNAVMNPMLSEEQQRTAATVLQSTDQLMIIRGKAGTGKTTMMKSIVAGIRSGGHEVHAYAPTAEASRGVLRAEGFAADTIASLLASPAKQQVLENSVLWIDEAGLAGSKELCAVLKVAKERNARVILTGDTAQHRSVARGDSLRILESEAGIVPAELREIHRQRGSYREAVQALSRGDTAKGLALLDRMGAVRELPDDERYAALASEYARELRGGRSVLAIAPTHAEGELVTRAVREKLKQEGRVAGPEHPLVCFQNVQWTQAERSDGRNYAEGLVVQFHQNAKGFRAGERYDVTRVESSGAVYAFGNDGTEKALPLGQADRFQVFRRGQAALAVGDRIRITQNGRTADGNHRFNNGAVFDVESITDRGDIRFTNGWTMPKDYGHWAFGFCATSHASQGKTTDTVLIAQSARSWRASSQEQFYVSASRARHGIQIFTDNKVELAAAVGQSGLRMSATELIKRGEAVHANPEQSRWQRLKDHARQIAQKAQHARLSLSRVAQEFVSRYARERNRRHELVRG